MTIDEFNALSPADAGEVVRVWADVPRWIEVIVAARPYPSVDALRRAAGDSATWTPSEVSGALAHHPRIGDRPTGSSPEDTASRREQSASADTDDATAAALRDGNARYEERFDRVFLIRAAGRTAPEILAELTRRLDNDDATETREVAGQLREIALLRLVGAFEETAA
jgi:2-oxo-4-hydroxy-4-carboxy-5-ureidoimidazoline decarboxylase